MGKITEPTAQRVSAWSGHAPERVLGTADVARRFGVTRQWAGQIARRDSTFPRPGLHDGFGHAFVAAGVECWAAAHRPTADTGRFGAETGAILRHAEGIAERCGHGYIDTVHLWHAMACGTGGAGLAQALRSMGIDPATIEDALSWQPATASTRRRMTPATQIRLEAADRAVRTAGRRHVVASDVALAFLDTPRGRYGSEDHFVWYAERRGLDTAELRRRLVLAAADSEIDHAFSMTPLPKRRPPRRALRRRPAGLEELMPNPLGHDPWLRQGWGSAFARTREGRHLTLDDKWWFFFIDADGYFVRATDGRPVGYRYRVITKLPKRLPGRPKMEVLPMPPFPLMDWPDGRYVPDD